MMQKERSITRIILSKRYTKGQCPADYCCSLYCSLHLVPRAILCFPTDTDLQKASGKCSVNRASSFSQVLLLNRVAFNPLESHSVISTAYFKSLKISSHDSLIAGVSKCFNSPMHRPFSLVA